MIESRLVAENPTWFGVDQYNNPKNPEAYYRTIAPEIWEQTNGEIKHFVAAASTGGTISGIGRFMKDRSNGKVQVICPDPIGSIFHEFWKSGGQTVKECESFFYQPVADAPILATHPQLRMDRAGSCGWDSRTRRCVILAPHKEACLTALLFSAAGKGPRFEPGHVTRE